MQRVVDRLDLKSKDFHKKVYDGYMIICKNIRWINKIDANKTIEEVTNQVIDVIKSKLWKNI